MISVIICSADARKFSAVSQMYGQLLAGSEFEIVRIADATGLSEGYNRGLSQSRGETLIFSHDDVTFFCEGFAARLMSHLEHCDLLGVAGTTRLCDGNWLQSGPPYIYGQIIHHQPSARAFEVCIYGAPSQRVDRIQALDGVFLCCKRNVADAIRFDQQTFVGFHLYDLDFSFRAHLAGYKLAVCNDLDLLHQSVGNYDASWAADSERFRRKHAGRLAPFWSQNFSFSATLAPTLQEALERMHPPHWTE